MEMKVGPTKGDLEVVVELGKSAVATDQEPPPDHGADPTDPDVELIDLGNGITDHGLGQGNQAGSRSSAPGLFQSPSLHVFRYSAIVKKPKNSNYLKLKNASFISTIRYSENWVIGS